MKSIIVLIAKGKGKESADYITPKLFQNEKEANDFIKSINDLESKYWTYAEIVNDGQEIEPWHGSF